MTDFSPKGPAARSGLAGSLIHSRAPSRCTSSSWYSRRSTAGRGKRSSHCRPRRRKGGPIRGRCTSWARFTARSRRRGSGYENTASVSETTGPISVATATARAGYWSHDSRVRNAHVRGLRVSGRHARGLHVSGRHARGLHVSGRHARGLSLDNDPRSHVLRAKSVTIYPQRSEAEPEAIGRPEAAKGFRPSRGNPHRRGAGRPTAAPAARPSEAPCPDQRTNASRPKADSFGREAKRQQVRAEE